MWRGEEVLQFVFKFKPLCLIVGRCLKRAVPELGRILHPPALSSENWAANSLKPEQMFWYGASKL